ncbi:DUF4913 domain-containing protein [Nocardia macrotermitis]|uniref:DUF4913 domain-containing protein n=1 Tax=Nocardia macrotermitis TaxID=2585198 RepID=A0A7K0D7I2_9NOCA|nr:DUF4913 domain-containing protein [Nocardia macrotermitis]MQY21716.1 hypothetical protein [Nocardia macrotermitis]
MGERSTPSVYGNVVEFVQNYLNYVYARQVQDRSDTVWCPQWWTHPEAVVRLDSLWRSWEYFRSVGRPGLSTWFLDYADPQMYRLFDPRGTFGYCSVQGGHRNFLEQLPTQPSESSSVNSAGFAHPARVYPENPRFADVGEFVEEYLRFVYQRQVSDPNGMAWCPQWWKHAEAVLRLDAVWRSWERLRLDPGPGLTLWFLDHADPQMRRIFDHRGPFRYCSVRHGHRDTLEPLPVLSAPTGISDTAAEDIASDNVTQFENVVRFVEDFLSSMYRRQVTDLNDTAWCPEWWRHAEAVVRLDALWRAWEDLGRDGTTGPSIWFRNHADPHMTELLDHRGPFGSCSARNGHRDSIGPLPLLSPPADLFATPKPPDDGRVDLH